MVRAQVVYTCVDPLDRGPLASGKSILEPIPLSQKFYHQVLFVVLLVTRMVEEAESLETVPLSGVLVP